MRRRWIPAFFAFALVAGCYPPALRVQDPPPSETGVRVVLRGQDCAGDLALSDGRGSRSLALELRVENPTREPLEFQPSRARLSDSGVLIPPVAPREPIPVAPGGAGNVVLRYLHNRECDAEFVVSLDGAILLGGREIGLGELRLRPY